MVMVWLDGGQGEVRGACAPPPQPTPNRPTWTPPPYPSQAGSSRHPPRAPPGVRGAACEGQTHHCHTKCPPPPPPPRPCLLNR